MKKISYIPIFCILILTALLHIIGTALHLYWTFWWFDIVVHFLGGVWIAATGFWVYYMSLWRGGTPPVRVIRFFAVTVFCSVIVGVLWELFEYGAGLTFVLPGVDYQTDTLADIGMDVVGGLCAYLYYRLKYWKLFI
jgi:hypothetical protein